MKRSLSVSVVLLVPLLAAALRGEGYQESAGLFLGQEPPGTTPKIFAPGIVSTDDHEFSCTFTPDGEEFYFGRRGGGMFGVNEIWMTRLQDGEWTEPVALTFPGESEAFEPQVTPDGQRMYFMSSNMGPYTSGPPMNVWYLDREGEGWSEMKNAGDSFNPGKHMYVSSTLDGTLYTTDIAGGPGSERIVVAERRGESYPDFQELGPPISVGEQDRYPFIAPDGDFLLFNSARTAGDAVSGLFVSFREEDGGWGEPKVIRLGMRASLPHLSPDGRFLFFTSGEQGRGDIWWVDAKVITDLRED